MADNTVTIENGENKENVENVEKVEEEKITLESSEGQKYEVPRSLAIKSTLIKDLLTHCDMSGENSVIPLPNVKTWCLGQVVEWLNNHREEMAMDERQEKDYQCVDEFDRKFFGQMDHLQHCEVVAAANYLAIKRLLDNGCKLIAAQMVGVPIPEIRKKFNIVNDYTKEEEDLIILENKWIDD